MLNALLAVGRQWLDPQSSLRQQAIASAAEFCLSPESFALAIDWIFSQWTEAKLTTISKHHPHRHCRYAVQILAGNTPAVIAQGFLQGCLLNIPQAIKLPSRQTRFAELLHQSIRCQSAALADLFTVSTWQDNLDALYEHIQKADLVLAYGSDETLAAIKPHIGPQTQFIAHGHAESAAIIFNEGATQDTLVKLADDMLSYDQRGCLSPRIAYIETGGMLSPAECARIFAQEILPQRAAELPRGGLFAGEAAEILHQRSVYGFRGQVYTGSDWTVCFTEQSSWPSVVLPRFLPIASFRSLIQLVDVLNPIQARLISLGCGGSFAKELELKQLIKTRYSPLGEMQKQLLVF